MTALAPASALRSPVIIGLIILCCAVELALQAADRGLIGTTLWRSLAYQNGAFWTGLLGNWRPNYALQPYLMFFTYAFLHAGLSHLIGNMLTLLFLGAIVQDRGGWRWFLLIYGLSALGGAAVFGLLNSDPHPMVGASGALFGLAGAWQVWDWSDQYKLGAPIWTFGRILLGFALLNLLVWWGMDGQLAWETHLGGFLVGCALAQVQVWRTARKRPAP